MKTNADLKKGGGLMQDIELKEMIKKEEGCRLEAYQDTRGFLTIGHGHRLFPGSRIPQAAADVIFDADFEKATADCLKLQLDLDADRRAVVVDMIFNMGLAKVQNFKKFLAHLRDKNWIQAAYELMASEYAKQVPERAKRNRDRILRGH
jgi:lysozyme